MSERTGKIDFRVRNETHQTWYRVIGDIHSGVTPLLLLHGGPGFSHHYLLPFKQLHDRFHIPLIFYDQLGIGGSSHPENVSEDFWTYDLFMDEIDNLVAHLGIKDNFDLFGHSGGAILAVHYVTHRHPSGLRRLVLTSPAPSTALWEKSFAQLSETLPEGLREPLERHEREGTIDHPEYQAALRSFEEKHLCQVKPLPEEFLASVAAQQANPTVNMTMLGPFMFKIVGTLKDWSCLDRIHTIGNPTLLTNSVDDPIQDVCLEPFFTKLQNVRWVTLAKSSHMPMFEEPDRYFGLIGNFLTGA